MFKRHMQPVKTSYFITVLSCIVCLCYLEPLFALEEERDYNTLPAFKMLSLPQSWFDTTPVYGEPQLLFYTQEFGYIKLAADVTTGSSIMPQKRNPDVLELVRGATSTAQACLQECMMIAAKLPSGFQRDLQRMKAPVFRSIDLTIESVDIMTHLISKLEFLPENIKLGEELYATEEAYELVRSEGIPFREAYRRIGARYSK